MDRPRVGMIREIRDGQKPWFHHSFTGKCIERRKSNWIKEKLTDSDKRIMVIEGEGN